MDDLRSTELIDLERLLTIEEEFSDATALGVITVDSRGIPVTPACGFTEFCMEIRKDPVRRMRCYSCDAHGGLQAAIEGRPHIYRCHAGLIDFSIPIINADQYVGAILCGQAKVPEDLDSGYLLGRDETWQSNAALVELYDHIPTGNLQKIQSAANMLSSLTHALVRKATSSTVIPVAVDAPTENAPTAPLLGAQSASDSTEITALTKFATLRLNVENEDLPGAVRSLTAYLDDLFSASGRYVGKDRLVDIEDQLTQLADSVCQAASNGVRREIHRRRTRIGTHLNRYKCQTYLESLLHIIIAEAENAHPTRTMASLLNLIERIPTRAWTLNEAANFLGLSISRTSKRFKVHTGKSFVTYISEKRVERAKLMLLYTDMPVVKIARELNFLPNYFSRVFKLSADMPPSQYRERFGVGIDV